MSEEDTLAPVNFKCFSMNMTAGPRRREARGHKVLSGMSMD